MKKLITLIILSATITLAIDWGNLSIRVRLDRYLVKQTQVAQGMRDLWNRATQKPEGWDSWTEEHQLAWSDQGYCYTTNTPDNWKSNIVFESLNHLQTSGVPNKEIWMFYNVTDLQTGDRATDARVKYWKGVAGNTKTFKIFRNGIEVNPKDL